MRYMCSRGSAQGNRITPGLMGFIIIAVHSICTRTSSTKSTICAAHSSNIYSSEYGRCGNNFWPGQSARIRDQERSATDCADRVIVVSNHLRDEITWMYEVPQWKASTIYNGVNPKNYDGTIDPAEVKRRYQIEPMDPVVLFSGRLVYQKGADLLVDAIPAVLKFYPSAKFIFAGDGEMRSQVEDRARQLGIMHATRFLGFQGNVTLTDLYKACDAVCVPSRIGLFGIVVLDACSGGNP